MQPFSDTSIPILQALASQSLAIMISLIPYVRETFRRHLSQQQAVMLIEFDKVKRVRSFDLVLSTATLSLRRLFI